MSFVHGPDNVAFLKKRFAAMSAHHCWHGMEYTEDKKKLSEWVPLVMEGRAGDEQVAATRIITGADVDYGSLTRQLVGYLTGMKGAAVHYSHRVTGISREPGGRWRIHMKNRQSGEKRSATAKFVYLGAGGGALPLLQKSKIPEGRGYGGFPVSGAMAWIAPSWPGPPAMVDSRRTATRVTRGATSLSNSSHFPPMEYSNAVKPVTLPPGRARLST